ncbi:protein-glutamate O-methyltransferase CheR [Cryobacterium sp. HLT2-28]|uniref:CheR family methyltransferase n=1 Tax=Cryobacterium sp. HLT2-28 TaxID=1259146 RepID=UPI00106CD6CE|nr:protein-glutamate O-methyltransferase CheR [Cryobacterium sp. HLT2-28]TFB96140.1 protein-glutamate O-methyltransferase CheR [Cryobacterium sp. HLT2-28]
MNGTVPADEARAGTDAATVVTDAVVDRVAELLRSVVGLRAEPTLRARMRRCIRDEIADYGHGAESYLRALTAGGALRQSLLNRITVQETGFFRHPEHFALLEREILPATNRPLSIWSAGCANGQEAYSLAMLLDEQRITGSIIATDISTSALARTDAARYSTREVSGLAPARLERHLSAVGDGWEITPALRTRVSTMHHNLIDPVPSRVRSCQIVFCRNVLIYFSPEHARIFLDRVAQAMPAAWLFLGSSETIWAIGDRYETVRFGDTYAYRPLAGPGIPPPAPRSPAAPPPVAPPGPRRVAPAPTNRDEAAVIAGLARSGQTELEAGHHAAAVVIFRKWVYLAPRDSLAHLHLGLALEASADPAAAFRAYSAARRALDLADPAEVEDAIDGYSIAELHKLLDAKQQEPTR